MSAPSPSPTPAPRGRWVLPVAFLAVVAAAGVAIYSFWPKPVPPPPPPQDIEGALGRNSRGVALMEQTKYAEAEREFAAAMELASEWLPARVNYGIALFNQQPADSKQLAEKVQQAQRVFADVLTRDPDDIHAHYCLGMIDLYIGRAADAYPHFQAANRLAPDDAHTWLRLGTTHPDGIDSPAAAKCYREALKLDPYLNEARYKLFIALRDADPAEAERLLTEHEALATADRFTESRIVYGEMGRYGNVIGRDTTASPAPDVGPLPMFEPTSPTVTLTDGATWGGGLDPTLASARGRFGATVVVFDYNADARPDVLVLAAVTADGRVRDLFLRNDGDGKFADVTAAVGLGDARASLGAATGDYDNDGRPDLVVSTRTGLKLFRNSPEGRFTDVTAEATLDAVPGLFLGCTWADLDQDSDLDLVACRYTTADSTKFDAADATGGVQVFENVGVAPPGPANGPAPALTTAFKANAAFADVFPTGPAVAVLASDVDDDHDLDLVALYDAKAPVVAVNDRLMRWRAGALPGDAVEPARWNGGLVMDVNHDERSDLLLLPDQTPPVLLLSRGEREFTLRAATPLALRQATGCDLDLDGWPDAVGLSAEGTQHLLHNTGEGGFETVNSGLAQVPGAVSILAGDVTGDGRPDLLGLGGDGLHLLRGRENGNHSLVVVPTGRRDKGSNLRTNNDGIGTWIIAQTGGHWTGAERTTTAAGLGQSLLPTTLGLGRNTTADALRVRWSDNVVQAELAVAAGTPFRLIETNRKGTSCPVLMTWDGERFVFVTDFLGVGAMGESGPDGSIRPPRGEESVKIEPGQLVTKDGAYLIKIAEPMDEVLYLDHLQLVAVDHPAARSVYPDERFVFAGPEPTQALLAFDNEYRPTRATDDAGRDVSERITTRDRNAVDTFRLRSWLGYAEDHSLVLEFDALPKADRWHLVLAGWTEYPYPESMYAATRAGVALQPPVVEQYDPTADKWTPLCDLGFPAGLPRVMTRELPTAPTGKLRIRTNMQVYWDEVYLAPSSETQGIDLDVKQASLAHRGFMQEVYPDGRLPVAYDDAKVEPVATTRWNGRLTKLGDVTELLAKFDDRFVLCGPGDEITVRFDASTLPDLKPGWQRSFVLRTKGYCKDTSTTTVTGGSVGPLPFRGMPNYPEFGSHTPPKTDADLWHTRPAGGK